MASVSCRNHSRTVTVETVKAFSWGIVFPVGLWIDFKFWDMVVCSTGQLNLLPYI